MSAQTNPAEHAVLVQRSAAQLIRMVLRLAQYAAGDPREEIRRDAERRMEAALEAILGMDWSTAEQMAIVYSIKAAAECGRDAGAVVAEDPTLAGHEDKVRAAIDGWAARGRVWPPLLELLEAAGRAGGITDPLHLKRKWKRYEAAGIPPVFQPFGFPPPTP